MNFKELLEACATQGKLPRVQVRNFVHNTATTNEGTVTVIKQNANHQGCAVLLDGMKWDTWFHDSSDTDKRSRYMRDLILIK